MPKRFMLFRSRCCPRAAPRGRIARLTTAGLLGRAFSDGAGANSYIDDILQQPDGKLVVVGDFTSINGQTRKRVARLEAVLPRDLMPPVIALNGDNPMNVRFGSAFVDPGARVIDEDDAERVILGSGSVNARQPGTHRVTYSATDPAGNAALPVERAVEVLPPDRAAPTIALLGDESTTVILGSVFTDPGARIVDDSDVERIVLGVGFADTNKARTYALIYKATDAAGNAASSVTRTVHVTAISALKPLKDSLTIRSGKKGEVVILLSNNTMVVEQDELQIRMVSGGNLVTVPTAKLPFKAAGKRRPTSSPPKITRVSLAVTAARGQKGPGPGSKLATKAAPPR